MTMPYINETLESLLRQSLLQKATDIHLDIRKEFQQIIVRRHKQHIETVAHYPTEELFSYLKYCSNFDLTEHRLPQSGSFSYVIDRKEYYFRFAAIESFNNKNGVLRILNANDLKTLSDCTGDKKAIHAIRTLLRLRNGVILFAGQTGSGKSTSMFCSLAEIVNKQIYSLEQPVERIYDAIIQLDINPKARLDFDAGLIQLLRHDPDIIVVGEIRSPDEAQQVVRCGLSGHLILATIHSGSAQQVWHRLVDLGCKGSDLRSVLKGIVFQSLGIKRNGGVHVALDIIDQDTICQWYPEAAQY